jgi:thiol-disulfide isomerase/thioredoxin
VEGVSVAVKRQVLFFAMAAVFVGIVLASYVAVRSVVGVGQGENKGENHAPLPRLPIVSFYDKSDKQLTLDDFKGKVVLVNLWATWCPPCIAELPSMARLQKSLSADKFKVVAISMDTKLSMKQIAAFLKKNGAKDLDIYWDKDRQLPMKWKYEGLPTSFLIDREGNTVERYDGPVVWDEGSVMGEIRGVIGK